MLDKKMVFDKKKIVETANLMNERPYKMGGKDIETGFDCLSYLIFFYNQVGADLPDEYNGYTFDNYLEKYLADPEKSKKEFIIFLKNIGERINCNFIQPGDLLLIKTDSEEEINTGIYVGASNILTCDVRIGMLIIPKGKIKKIIGARRLCPKPFR